MLKPSPLKDLTAPRAQKLNGLLGVKCLLQIVLLGLESGGDGWDIHLWQTPFHWLRIFLHSNTRVKIRCVLGRDVQSGCFHLQMQAKMWKRKRRGRDSNAMELPGMSLCGWNTWSRRWHFRLWCWRTAGRWMMDTYSAQEFQINHWEPPAALSRWSVCWWGEGFYHVVDITNALVVPETI